MYYVDLFSLAGVQRSWSHSVQDRPSDPDKSCRSVIPHPAKKMNKKYIYMRLADFLIWPIFASKWAPEQKIKNQASLHLLNFAKLSYETDFYNYF